MSNNGKKLNSMITRGWMKGAWPLVIFWLLAGALHAQTLERVEAVPWAAAKPAVLRFWFASEQPITPSWRVGVVFPQTIDLNLVRFADSKALNGGFEVSVRRDTLWIWRSGAGDSLKAGRFDVMAAMVGLPENIDDPVEWCVITQKESGSVADRRRIKIEAER